jgi:hypothetical protein
MASGAAFWGLVGASALVFAADLAFPFQLRSKMIGLIVAFGFGALISSIAFERVAPSLKTTSAAVLGLLWKVWLVSEAGQEGGSIYLFADDSSLESYLNSQAVAGIVSHPLLRDASVKQLDAIKVAVK